MKSFFDYSHVYSPDVSSYTDPDPPCFSLFPLMCLFLPPSAYENFFLIGSASCPF